MLLAWLGSSRAHAQADASRLQLASAFGVTGKVSIDPRDNDISAPADDELVTTYGAAFGVELPLLEHFTLGAELAVAFWNTESRADPPDDDWYDQPAFDRHRQLDLLARPKLRVCPGSGVELYGVAPVGLTYFITSRDSDTTWNDITFQSRGGPGLAVGAAVGAMFFIREHFGLTFEAGYLYRLSSASITAGGYSDSTVKEWVRFGQVQVRAGLAYAF
jgi:hypothetical protein